MELLSLTCTSIRYVPGKEPDVSHVWFHIDPSREVVMFSVGLSCISISRDVISTLSEAVPWNWMRLPIFTLELLPGAVIVTSGDKVSTREMLIPVMC